MVTKTNSASRSKGQDIVMMAELARNQWLGKSQEKWSEDQDTERYCSPEI